MNLISEVVLIETYSTLPVFRGRALFILHVAVAWQA